MQAKEGGGSSAVYFNPVQWIRRVQKEEKILMDSMQADEKPTARAGAGKQPNKIDDVYQHFGSAYFYQNRSKSVSGDATPQQQNSHAVINIQKPAVVQGNIQHANDDTASKASGVPLSSVSRGSGGVGKNSSVSMRTTTTTRDEISRLKQELEREKQARKEAERRLLQTQNQGGSFK